MWKAITFLAAAVAIGSVILALYVFNGEAPGSNNKDYPQVCLTAPDGEIRCKPDCDHIPKESLESLTTEGTDRRSAERVLKWHKMYWDGACPKRHHP